MKEILITIITLASISVANASMDECLKAGQNRDFDGTIEYCKEFANTSQVALGFLGGAYAGKYKGLKAQEALQDYINKYGQNINNKYKDVTIGYYTSLGNYYYFGEDGAKKDIQKGLEYITKGAELGNVIAQYQLGSFYGSNESSGVSKNFAQSYYWYIVSDINGANKLTSSYVYQNLDAFKKQLPYCIAQGDQLVAQAYINGNAGLSQDKYKAKKYLADAIALYKKEDKPSADELKFCPPQKGLDLKSAEKLLAGL